MHALQILVDGVKDRNLVARQKTRIRVTVRAPAWLILFCNLGIGFARRLDFVPRAMAGETGFVLLERLSGLFLKASRRGKREKSKY